MPILFENVTQKTLKW